MTNGFVFGFDSELGKAEVIGEKDILSIGERKRNKDDIPLLVHCEHCNIYMDFQPGPTGELDGLWRCPDCGATVDERDAYVELDKENRDFLKQNELE